ncbi:hypothetical protein HMPREF1157_0244 [Staphylococcus epidermidis E13A]|nr:hypothetical protein HMPREF1157_0244 [Staphylococcus epidermidis E13A]
MNWLKIFYHLLCATTISVILLIITILMDVLLQNTHLTQLLLNIDFLINPDEVPTIIEVLIHLSIGILIYLAFLIIYHYSKSLYHLAYLPLVLIFTLMYPLLVFLAQRPFFPLVGTNLHGG